MWKENLQISNLKRNIEPEKKLNYSKRGNQHYGN